MDLDISSAHVRALLAQVDWELVGLIVVPVLLAAFVLLAARSERPDRRITLLASAIGLGWSAQGMWETATVAYKVPAQLAVVLFVLFEAFMVGRMLNANRFRGDPQRRARPVRFVWTLALIMGTVVALAEGWHQAPLRFSVPLLVAWNWYLDLTSDDDPATAARTSWRWTPRRVLLAVGALEPGERDAVTIDRDRHVGRMTTLAFREQHGATWLSDVLRRRERLMRLALTADDPMVREMHDRLTRASSVLLPPAPIAPARMSSLHVPSRRLLLPKDDVPGVQGVHTIDGQVLRGEALRRDAVARMMASVTPDAPRGMRTAELAALYDPPLRTRTADTFAGEARKRINGSPVG